MRLHTEVSFAALLVLGCAACTGRDIVLGGPRSETTNDGGDRDAGGSDAANQDSGEQDAGRPLPPFWEPVPIDGIASDDSVDDDPSLTADLTVLYFNSERAGGQGEEDIWFSTRASRDDAWSAPQPATELNSEQRETGIALAADGLTIWFSSDRDEADGTLDIFTATRSARGEPFSTPSKVEALSSTLDDLVSAIDERTGDLYLARRDDGGDYDLFVAARTGDTFADPAPLDALNSSEEESDAFVVSDRHLLFFTRDEELVVATREDDGAPFAFGFALDELNSSEDDRDVWVSRDLSYLVFSSNRSGAYHLYEARR